MKRRGARARLPDDADRVEERLVGDVVVGVTRLRDMAPHASELQEPRLLGSARFRHSHRPVLREDAVAVQTRVDLEVHACRSSERLGARDDPPQIVDRADAEIDPLHQRMVDLVIRRCDPGEDPGIAAGDPADGETGADVVASEPLDSRVHRGIHRPGETVTVRIVLEHEHQRRRVDTGAHRIDVRSEDAAAQTQFGRLMPPTPARHERRRR